MTLRLRNIYKEISFYPKILECNNILKDLKNLEEMCCVTLFVSNLPVSLIFPRTFR